jgi:lysophospholipase L1-like esterase
MLPLQKKAANMHHKLASQLSLLLSAILVAAASQLSLLLSAILVAAASQAVAADASNVHFRGSFDNCRIRFEQEKKGHVAFIGGSITEMNGYRPMVCDILKRRFPDTEFTFTDAGISSTCSTTGAFRLAADVLAKGPVDLFFVEFAVNDDQDAGHARRECIRGMEGIIRQCRRYNPAMDIVVTHFTNPSMVETIRKGGTPLSSGSHDVVTKYYNICTIDLAREVAQQIDGGTLTWKQFGGTHPAPHGNKMCADMIDRLMATAWEKPLSGDAKKKPHPMPEKPLDANHYGNGRFIDPARATIRSGWTLHTPDWAKLPGGKRGRFTKEKLLCATEPGATMTLKFTGKAIGAYILAGPDAGAVEAVVDGGEPKTIETYHRYSRGLHYPRTVMFAADLDDSEHTLTLRLLEKTNKSGGAAMRILQFTAN